MGHSLNRRAAIIGAVLSAGALAVPVAAATKGDKLQHFLDTASADDLIQYHAGKLAEALCESRPGLWRFSTASVHSDECAGILLFHRTESTTFNGYAQDFK